MNALEQFGIYKNFKNKINSLYNGKLHFDSNLIYDTIIVNINKNLFHPTSVQVNSKDSTYRDSGPTMHITIN